MARGVAEDSGSTVRRIHAKCSAEPMLKRTPRYPELDPAKAHWLFG